MKRILFTAIVMIISMSGFSSCSTTSRTGITAPITYTEVHPNEILANFDFNTTKKIEGTVKVSYLFGIKVGGGREYAEVLSTNHSKSIFGLRGKRARSMAMAKALKGSEYDMIVNPQYETEKKKSLFGLWTTYTVTVKGYGAKINKLYQADKPADRRDIPLTRN